MRRAVIVVQARRGSSRLPSKVLLPLAGKPLLERMIERVRAASVDVDAVVATTTDAEDDVLADVCRSIDIPCYRGHPTDLLDRHVQCARWRNADVVVKIPSDCPLIDPRVIDRVIGYYVEHETEFDYVSNLHPASYPDGNDVEVMTTESLLVAWRQAVRPLEREHTTPFLWENPGKFRIGNVFWETGLDYSKSHRWTIDYEEDYRFISSVYDELAPAHGGVFGIREILDLLARRPDIAEINARYAGQYWYSSYPGELKNI